MRDIPEVDFETFKDIVLSGRIGELKSCRVMKDGELVFTAIIGHGDIITKEYAETQAEGLGLLSNTIGGKDAEELLPVKHGLPDDILTCPDCGKVCANFAGLSAHSRSHRKEQEVTA